MPALLYLGSKASVTKAVGTQGGVDAVKATALTEAQVDSRIQAKLANFATTSYADQQDALRATRAYVDQQDALRVPLSAKDQAGGPVGLNSSGDIPLARIPAAYRTFQRGPRAYYSPSAYMSNNYTTSSASQTLLWQCSIADPGWAYKLLVWGYFEAIGSGGGAYNVCNVRVGSSTGQIVARSFGQWRGDWGPGTIVPDMTVTQTARTGATTLNVYGYRGGPAESVTFGSFYDQMAVIAVPA